MESEEPNEFYQKYRFRTKKFAIDLCRVLNKFPRTLATYALSRQLVRSGTSVAANFRAASRARSLNELYSKMCIVVEECDETVFWLEILAETEVYFRERLAVLHKEAEELLKIFSVSKKKLNALRKPS
jgi:four helix bundle protein